MLNENQLATYSLLSMIKDTKKYDGDILDLFIPIIIEALNILLEDKGKELKGKDYSEIFIVIKKFFGIEIPIPIIQRLMKKVKEYWGEDFILYEDHAFIIKNTLKSSTREKFSQEKTKIELLEQDFNKYCDHLNIAPNFEDLIIFIQDQKNRIFDNIPSQISEQSYHISKYIENKLKNKDKDPLFDIICSIHLGGIISSYFSFQLNSVTANTQLLIDTNFFLGLVDLNTEESFIACNQLHQIATQMGYSFYILETTKEQIKDVLNKRIKNYNQNDIIAAVNNADVMNACVRRGLNKSDLQRYKDNLDSYLGRYGITTIYNQQIQELYKETLKSSELEKWKKIRRSFESALNDLLAKNYVLFKRRGKSIIEFNDVNCWFLTNSISFNNLQEDKPIWERFSIDVSDLLLLLWLSNPSLNISISKEILTITNLSANVIKYRANAQPKQDLIIEIHKRSSLLFEQGQIRKKDLAKLCIRMVEGSIGQNEAEKIVSMSGDDLKVYLENISKEEDENLKTSKENQDLKQENETLKKLKESDNLAHELFKMRTFSIGYILLMLAIYVVGNIFIPQFAGIWRALLDLAYLIITFTIAGLIKHSYFLWGLYSFINKNKVINKLKIENNSLS